MSNPSRPVVLHFDFVDPISYLLAREIEVVEADLGLEVERIGVEINPPPHPIGTPDDPLWSARWEEGTRIAEGLGLPLRRPALVPWSRKAHELMEHAAAAGPDVAAKLGTALFHAFFEEGRDIGRVDVLVGLARAAGLEETETKAVLDVDRYGEEIVRRRNDAIEAGLRVVPTVVVGDQRLEGFHNRASLSTFLRGSS